MDDIDMIFLFQHHLDGIDLSWLEGIDKRVREEEKNPSIIDYYNEEEDTWDESDDAFIQEAFKKMMEVDWNDN